MNDTNDRYAAEHANKPEVFQDTSAKPMPPPSLDTLARFQKEGADVARDLRVLAAKADITRHRRDTAERFAAEILRATAVSRREGDTTITDVPSTAWIAETAVRLADDLELALRAGEG